MSDFGHSVWSRSGNQGWPARGRPVARLTAVARPRKRIDCIPSRPGATVVPPLRRRRNRALLLLARRIVKRHLVVSGAMGNKRAAESDEDDLRENFCGRPRRSSAGRRRIVGHPWRRDQDPQLLGAPRGLARRLHRRDQQSCVTDRQDRLRVEQLAEYRSQLLAIPNIRNAFAAKKLLDALNGHMSDRWRKKVAAWRSPNDAVRLPAEILRTHSMEYSCVDGSGACKMSCPLRGGRLPIVPHDVHRRASCGNGIRWRPLRSNPGR